MMAKEGGQLGVGSNERKARMACLDNRLSRDSEMPPALSSQGRLLIQSGLVVSFNGGQLGEGQKMTKSLQEMKVKEYMDKNG